MGNVSTDTWVRTGLLILTLINQILTTAGKNPIPGSEEDWYATLTTVLTLAASAWAWWKNNSITKNAIKADEYLDELKNEEAA